MNVEHCLQILRDVKDVAFATVNEQGEPRVRIIDVMIVEDGKLYFCTARGKDFYEELIKSGHVGVTGINKEYQSVRLHGIAKRLKNQKYWIDRIFEENPVMNGVYPGESRYILDAFCIEEGEVELFDLGKEPIYREYFSLGSKEIADKGYEITENCIGCGTCKQVCPQQCITEGTPYYIEQNHCLHCGLCYKNCLVQAVRKRGWE